MKLVRLALARPRVVLLAMIVLTLAAASGLPRLTLRMDGHALIPPDDPAVAFDREVREEFGIRDPLVVMVETTHPDGIYNPETLRLILDLSERMVALDGIGPEHVMSLATERRDRVYPGTLRFRPFLDPFPDTPRLLELLQEDVAAAEILTGTLVSYDGTAAAILVGVPREGRDVPALYRRILAEARPFETETDRIRVVGAPAAEALLGEHILEDLALLLPLSITLMAGILWFRLRRVWGVLLGLGEIAAALAFTFGLMGWLGIPVYLTTAVLPVVLITLGLADEIHIFFHYQALLARQGEVAETGQALRRTMAEMVPPVFFTSLTTSIGFLSFTASGIEPVAGFGVAAVVGILFCLLWSLTAIPASLALLPEDRLRRPATVLPGALSSGPRGWSLRWTTPFLRHPRPSLLTLAGITAVLAAGVAGLTVQDSWIDGFAPRSTFRRDTERVNALFHGTHILLVHLEVAGNGAPLPRGDGKEGYLLDPALLGEIGRFEDFLRQQDGVGGVLGPYSHLSTVAYLWLARRPDGRGIPTEVRRVGRLYHLFETVRGEHRRREVVDDDLDRALVTIFLKAANYRDTAALIETIEDFAAEHLSARGITLGLAGDVALSQAMIPAIVRSQVTSLLLALGGAGIALLLFFRSPRLALLALAPASISVLWTFGAMGWLGIPLGVATSMFCAIALGVGVDYGIHFLASYRRAREAGLDEGARRAVEEVGPAITTDMLAITGSFGLLVVSQVPANTRLGLLVAISLASACVLTLGGLGSWLVGRGDG